MKAMEGITIDAGIMGGLPVITGTRMPVSILLSVLAGEDAGSGAVCDTWAIIHRVFPQFTVVQIRTAILFACEVAEQHFTVEGSE